VKQIHFAFWNVNKRNVCEHLVALIEEFDIHVMMLAEASPAMVEETQKLLRSKLGLSFSLSGKITARVKLIHRLPKIAVNHIGSETRSDLWSLEIGRGLSMLLVGVHFPDRRNYDASDRNNCASSLSSEISRREKALGHTNTIVVGDFNMNPFDEGMCVSNGFHAVMDRRRAAKIHRTVLKDKHRYFYNPMWQLMGKSASGALGTFHHSGSKSLEYFWHTLDQVILRPSLLRAFNDDSVDFVERAGSTRFSGVANGFPLASDHLPIKFSIGG
jgi:hypothetical protein